MHNEVLQHFDLTGPSIKVRDTFTREVLDKHEKELGQFYKGLLEYSLINKNINLQESNNLPIFTGSQEQVERLNALNNNDLSKAKGQTRQGQQAGVIKLDKRNIDDHIQHDGSVYERVSDSQTEGVYMKIGTQDANFYVTKIETPFNNELIQEDNEPSEKRTNVKESEGTELNCKKG